MGIFVIALIIVNRKKQKTIKCIKVKDTITGYDNFTLLEERFKNEVTGDVRSLYCVANIGIQLNHIESVYGYSEINEILKDVADVLYKNVDKGEFFARMNQNAFIYVAKYTTIKNVTERFENIVNRIKEYESQKGKNYELEINIGIYFLKQSDNELHKIIYNAMLARKDAQRKGVLVKNYTEALMMKVKKENKLEKEIVKALKNKEFLTYVQPMLDLKKNGISILEVLARWESPQMGLVRPSSFLSILEENNIIDILDFEMYENACKLLAKIKNKNDEMPVVFCNFSRMTMERKDFYDRLKQTADKYGISEKYIGIIITKSNVNKGTVNLMNTINKLKEHNFTILLDDFDTLTYSFNEIKEFSIDYIKISSRLTKNLNDARTITILKGIIDTVHSLNIKVICEDFNDIENEEILRETGCDMVQGSSYYQPIPVDEL